MSDDNSSAIAEGEGEENATVTIDGRTLFKDYSWNTLCLPFNMTKNEVNTQLYPDYLMELDTDGDHDGKKTGFNPVDGTLYLYFKSANSIEAGKPYIISWYKSSGKDINFPAFYGVTITSSTPTRSLHRTAGSDPCSSSAPTTARLWQKTTRATYTSGLTTLSTTPMPMVSASELSGPISTLTWIIKWPRTASS